MTAFSQLSNGIELLKTAQYEQAIVVFTKGIKIDTAYAELYYERGVCYFHLQKIDKSIADMDKAVALEPTNAFRYASRAFIKGASGDVKGGIKDYEKAISLHPDDAISHNNLGLLQEKLGYEKQAKTSFKKADTISKNNPDFEKLFTSKEEKHGNSSVLNTSTTPKLDLIGATKKKQEIKQSKWNIVAQIFTSRQTFSEFINFLKSGFKLDN